MAGTLLSISRRARGYVAGYLIHYVPPYRIHYVVNRVWESRTGILYRSTIFTRELIQCQICKQRLMLVYIVKCPMTIICSQPGQHHRNHDRADFSKMNGPLWLCKLMTYITSICINLKESFKVFIITQNCEGLPACFMLTSTSLVVSYT